MRILVGYTVTDEGRAALGRSIEEAQLRGATLVVAHSTRGGERDETERSKGLDREFSDLEDRLRRAEVPYQLRQLVRGEDPADDLLRFAAEVEAAMIVIGVRRRSPVGKLLLGSTAQQIILQADCPVLAVKADDE